MPPGRKVKFKTDLVPGADLIAKEPYRLAPPNIQYMST